MAKISIPSIEALATLFEVAPQACRPVYLLLFGVASARFDVGFNETLDDAFQRIAEAKVNFFSRRSSTHYLTLSRFAEFVNELRQAIDQYGEMTVLQQGLLQMPSMTPREELSPDQICRAFSNWKTDRSHAVVFDNNLDSLPFYLASKGKETVVFTNSEGGKYYWDLAGKATGLSLSGLYCGHAHEEFRPHFDNLPEEADCYLLGPFGEDLRFAGRTGRFLGQALLLSYILPRMKGRIAVMAPAGMAFAGIRVYPELRRSLVKSERLYSVVTFPGNMLDWSGIPMLGLFVSAASEKGKVIRFADFSEEAFYAQSNRRRRRILNEKGLAVLDALLAKEQTDMPVAEISKDRLLADDTVCLAPQNYLVELTGSDELKTIEKFPLKLSDIAEVIRPMLRRTAENGIPVREVGASDITVYGRVVEPRDTSFIEEEKVSESFERTILRRNDIVFCVKGSVARCGLIVDEPSERWTIGQMCVGIRLKPDAPISAVALLRYLRTDSFREYVKKIVPALALQARIAFMSAKDVENFPVPKLSPEQLSREETIFLEQEKALRKIKELEKAVVAAEPTEIPEDWK